MFQKRYNMSVCVFFCKEGKNEDPKRMLLCNCWIFNFFFFFVNWSTAVWWTTCMLMLLAVWNPVTLHSWNSSCIGSGVWLSVCLVLLINKLDYICLCAIVTMSISASNDLSSSTKHTGFRHVFIIQEVRSSFRWNCVCKCACVKRNKCNCRIAQTSIANPIKWHF